MHKYYSIIFRPANNAKQKEQYHKSPVKKFLKSNTVKFLSFSKELYGYHTEFLLCIL